MEQLVIRLGSSQEESVHWLVWSSEQKEIIASGELPSAVELHTLKERAGKRAVIALVPGSDVSLRQLALPAKASHKALSAIPYMLEDELSTDIDKLFFALGEKTGELQNLVVVEHQKMQMWQALLDDAELYCDKILPDMLALPVLEAQWSLMILGEQVLVRQGSWSGMQGEANWLFMAIAHFAKQQEEKVPISCLTEVNIAAIPNVEMTDNFEQLPMEVLAQGALSNSFNLLQGQYRQKKKTTGMVKQWRIAAALFGAAILLNVAEKAWQANELSAQNTQLQQQIRAEFKRAFPETRRIVDVRKQMRQKINQLEGNSGGVSLLAMLSQLSGAFSASKITPQSIRFDKKRSELRLQALASNFESLERFKTLAEQQGFEVQQGAINNRGDQVLGALVISS